MEGQGKRGGGEGHPSLGSPPSPCSPPLLEDERRLGTAGRFDKVQISLLHITRLFVTSLQFGLPKL